MQPPIDGKIIHRVNNVYILRNEFGDNLFEDGKLWTVDSEEEWYAKYLIPRVRGYVLEVGLGLGIASEMMLNARDVWSLTTLEINEDIIRLYETVKGRAAAHTIYHCDATKPIPPSMPLADFNFVFVDAWTAITEDEVDLYMKIKNNLFQYAPYAEFIPWFGEYQDLWMGDPDEFKQKLKEVSSNGLIS